MKWIDAGDIKHWVTAKRRHCEEKLPELLRRLIAASASTITRLDFPSGDSVTTGGWDARAAQAVVAQVVGEDVVPGVVQDPVVGHEVDFESVTAWRPGGMP